MTKIKEAPYTSSNYFRFGLVFIKKITKTNFFKKTKTGSNRLISVRFCYFREKTVQTGLARFFLYGSVFSGFFGLCSVYFVSGL